MDDDDNNDASHRVPNYSLFSNCLCQCLSSHQQEQQYILPKIVIYSKCEIIMVGSARRHMVTTVSSVCRMVVAVNLPKTFHVFNNNQPHALLIFVHISNDLIDFYSVASPFHSFVHQRSVCSLFFSFIVFVQVA